LHRNHSVKTARSSNSNCSILIIIIIIIIIIFNHPRNFFSEDLKNNNDNLGAIAPCSLENFLAEVGRRLSAATGDERETAFLFQRISVALQRFNAALIHESFVAPDVEPDP